MSIYDNIAFGPRIHGMEGGADPSTDPGSQETRPSGCVGRGRPQQQNESSGTIGIALLVECYFV